MRSVMLAQPENTKVRTVLSAQLLGGCAIQFDGRSIPVASFKRRRALLLLLRLLTIPGQSLPCDAAIELLWPGHDPEAGIVGLHVVLSSLRAALNTGHDARPLIGIRAHCLSINQDIDLRIDALSYERMAIAALTSGEIPILKTAAVRYAGPLLPNLPHEEWVRGYRDRLAQLYQRVLAKLAAAEEASDPSAAEERLRGLVTAQPTNEHGALTLMEILAGSGRRGEALALYDAVATALKGAFNVHPIPQIEALRLRLRAGIAEPQGGIPYQPGWVANGNITLIFAAVEGWERTREGQSASVSRAATGYETLFAGIVGEHGGRVYGRRRRAEVGSYLACFGDARDALNVATTLRNASQEAREDPYLPLRLVVHSADAGGGDDGREDLARERCALLIGLADPGQILVSDTTVRLCERLPARIRFQPVEASLPEREALYALQSG